jgi:hypothetical protein
MGSVNTEMKLSVQDGEISCQAKGPSASETGLCFMTVFIRVIQNSLYGNLEGKGKRKERNPGKKNFTQKYSAYDIVSSNN